jgi:predicted NBD/HSP70 family sugar kinase
MTEIVRPCLLSMDVGSETIKYGLASPGGEMLSDLNEIPSRSNQSQAGLLERFTGIVDVLQDDARERNLGIAACAMAMPAPFDYHRGISFMTHKFGSLYEFPLKTAMERNYGVPFMFLNDGDAFGYGMATAQPGYNNRTFMGVTIGKSLGATFMRGGETEVGFEIWHSDCGENILEDLVSARAIANSWAAAKQVPRADVTLTSAELAQKAAEDPDAQAAFEEMGKQLGRGLAAATGDRLPSRVACGGGVSKSFELFGPAAQQAYRKATGRRHVKFIPATEPDLAVRGAARYAGARL